MVVRIMGSSHPTTETVHGDYNVSADLCKPQVKFRRAICLTAMDHHKFRIGSEVSLGQPAFV